MPIQVNDINVIDDDRNIIASGIATVGSGSSSTIINGNTGIVNVGTGVTINGITGNISIAGTISAAGFNIPVSIVSFSPTNGATSQEPTTNISITFDLFVSKATTGIGTTANITLRNSSGIGTIIETIGVTSTSVTISGKTATIDPPNPIPPDTNVYVVIDEGAFASTNSPQSKSSLLDTYNFTTRSLLLGDDYEGGVFICQASGTRWVISPDSAEVSRDFYGQVDADTRAQQVSGCTGWFVPTAGQLQNPGYTCRTYWNYSSTYYWGSDGFGTPSNYGPKVSLVTGSSSDPAFVSANFRGSLGCIRAFRCVTY